MAVNQGPFTLVYLSVRLPDQSSARKREIELKSWDRTKKEKLIKGEIK